MKAKNKIIGLLIAVLLIAGGYALIPKPGQEVAPITTLPKEKKVEWEKMMPEIEKTMKQANAAIGSLNPLKAEEQVDITGDGADEALVDLGVGGIASKLYALMQIENGKPIVASMTGRDGKTSLAVGLVKGALTTNSADIKLYTNQNTFVTITYDINDAGTFINCQGDAYRWEESEKTFKWNQELSEGLGGQYCDDVASQNKNTEITGDGLEIRKGSVTGKYGCLPAKDSGSQTLECVYGIEDGKGEYYALDLGQAIQENLKNVSGGDTITASGTIIPAQQADTDQWAKFNITGIVKATKITKAK